MLLNSTVKSVAAAAAIVVALAFTSSAVVNSSEAASHFIPFVSAASQPTGHVVTASIILIVAVGVSMFGVRCVAFLSIGVFLNYLILLVVVVVSGIASIVSSPSTLKSIKCDIKHLQEKLIKSRCPADDAAASIFIGFGFATLGLTGVQTIANLVSAGTAGAHVKTLGIVQVFQC